MQTRIVKPQFNHLYSIQPKTTNVFYLIVLIAVFVFCLGGPLKHKSSIFPTSHHLIDLHQLKLYYMQPYHSRVVKKDWVLKFTENQNPDLHADWNELDRVYIMQPVTKHLWVRAVPDGGTLGPDFVKKMPAPVSAPVDTSQTFPQFSPLKLTGDAGEVAAKGQWKDGFWTVEFRRARETPVRHIFDTVFNRTVQFSVHVFDRVDTLDKVSESQRLFLQLLKPEQSPLSKPAPELAGQ